MTERRPPDLEETRVLGEPPREPAPEPEPEPEPSRQLGWGMLIGALVAVAALAGGLAIWFATRDDGEQSRPATTAATSTDELVAPGRVLVPDVTGLEQDEAAARLGNAGLDPEVRERPTERPTGIVVSQSPRPAEEVEQGSTVTIVVDSGAATVEVPDLTGIDVAAAGVRLKEAGLAAQTTNVTTADAEPGTVVAQSPTAGTEAREGAVVTLSVARGGSGTQTETETEGRPESPPPTATVPELTGRPLADAADELAGAGLYPNVVYVPSREPLGTVVAQAKAPGTEAERGGYVRVNVARGPDAEATATVPDLRGRAQEEASRTLADAGFEVKVLERTVPASRPEGTVVDEQPSRGSEIPRGALVILVVGTRQGA